MNSPALIGIVQEINTFFDERLLTASLLTVGFATLARWIRGVTTPGAMAGAIISFLIYYSTGISGFAALISVFILTWLATRFGYRQKQIRGTAEKRDGRNASQVFANLGIAALAALTYLFDPRAAWIAAMIASLAEAAADTVSSEVGQATADRAWLITTGKRVPAGTNGGISLMGTLAGIAAAAMVSLSYLWSANASVRGLVAAATAGILGMMIDSALGASLEERGMLNNNGVNFFGTLASACLAMALA